MAASAPGAPPDRRAARARAPTRVHRSLLGSRQRLAAEVEQGGLLVSILDPVVCRAGSRDARDVSGALADDASLAVVDAISSGRTARGAGEAGDRRDRHGHDPRAMTTARDDDHYRARRRRPHARPHPRAPPRPRPCAPPPPRAPPRPLVRRCRGRAAQRTPGDRRATSAAARRDRPPRAHLRCAPLPATPRDERARSAPCDERARRASSARGPHESAYRSTSAPGARRRALSRRMTATPLRLPFRWNTGSIGP
ncbi:urease accessory protein UreD [Sorangium sp. So ce1128]